MAETGALAIIHKENGHHFADLMVHEVKHQHPNAPQTYTGCVIHWRTSPKFQRGLSKLPCLEQLIGEVSDYAQIYDQRGYGAMAKFHCG